jgi:hypothetical protein
VVKAFEQASGRAVPFRIMPRRPGDVAQCYADPALAQQPLSWQARRSLADMCADAHGMQRQTPMSGCAALRRPVWLRCFGGPFERSALLLDKSRELVTQ